MRRRIQRASVALAAGLVAMAGALPAIAQVKAIQVDFKSPAQGAVIQDTAKIRVEAISSPQGVESGGIIKDFTIRIQPNGGTDGSVCRPGESPGLCKTVNYEGPPVGASRAGSRETLEMDWRTEEVTPFNGVYDVVGLARSDVPGVEDSDVEILQDIKVNNPPERPRSLAVSTPVRGEPKLTVTWAKNPEADVIRYEIFRAEGDGQFKKADETGANGTVFHDSDVPFDTPVRYQVVTFRASPVSSGGIGSPPATTSPVTVQAPPPPPSPSPSTTPGGVQASPKSGSDLKDLSGKLGTPDASGKVVKPVSLAAPNSITGPRRDGGSGFGRLLPFGMDAPQSLIDEEFAEAVGEAIRNPGELISQELDVNPIRFIAAAVLLLVTAGHLGRGAQSLFRSAKGASPVESSQAPLPV